MRRGFCVYVAAAALPLAILCGLPMRPIVVSKLGREVVLGVSVSDPRDLLKGDYVSLTFPAASVPSELFDGEPSAGEVWQIELSEGEDGLWVPSAARRSGAREPYLTGTVQRAQWREAGGPLKVDFGPGMRRFYVREGTGGEYEGKALFARVSLWRGFGVIGAVEAVR